MKEALAVSDGLNNSSKGRIRSRKKKSTPDNNVAVQKITVGSILVDNEAATTELRGIVSTDTGAGENGIGESVSLGEEVVVKKRKRASKSVGNEGAVRKRIRGSIPVDNEAVPTELRGIISTDIEAGTNRMMDLVPVVEEGVVKKRTRRTNSVGNEGAVRRSNTVGNKGVVRKKMRGSISVDNEAVSMELRGVISTDIDAETDGMMDPVSVGEAGVAKKRGRRANSVGEEGTVKRKRRGSLSVESNGAVTRRKRASSR
jgi:transcription factor MYB, plant